MLERERTEKLAVVNLFARLLGAGLNLKPETTTEMLENYWAELSQLRYQPTMIGAAYRKAKKEQRRKVQDKKLLERVDKYTVEDSDLPPSPGARKRRRG